MNKEAEAERYLYNAVLRNILKMTGFFNDDLIDDWFVREWFKEKLG